MPRNWIRPGISTFENAPFTQQKAVDDPVGAHVEAHDVTPWVDAIRLGEGGAGDVYDRVSIGRPQKPVRPGVSAEEGPDRFERGIDRHRHRAGGAGKIERRETRDGQDETVYLAVRARVLSGDVPFAVDAIGHRSNRPREVNGQKGTLARQEAMCPCRRSCRSVPLSPRGY